MHRDANCHGGKYRLINLYLLLVPSLRLVLLRFQTREQEHQQRSPPVGQLDGDEVMRAREIPGADLLPHTGHPTPRAPALRYMVTGSAITELPLQIIIAITLHPRYSSCPPCSKIINDHASKSHLASPHFSHRYHLYCNTHNLRAFTFGILACYC